MAPAHMPASETATLSRARQRDCDAAEENHAADRRGQLATIQHKVDFRGSSVLVTSVQAITQTLGSMGAS